MNRKKFIKSIGKRILSEMNDLKRTKTALANDINIDVKFLEKVISGNCELEDSFYLIGKIGSFYSIDTSDLYLLENDCLNAVKIMRSADSIKSSRVFKRINKNKIRTPYYEYQDTAMSRISSYKPEWIRQLRIVEDNDPYNPDVIYNNGHFMHQTTFFIGPVNFYWEVNGKKYCQEMNTGDSNYITPYWPHSFTSRDPKQKAYILAITFGGEARRAQKELYALGDKCKNYVLEYRNNTVAIKQLIKQHMLNENLTTENLIDLANFKSIEIDIRNIMKMDGKIKNNDLSKIALLLNIELEDLLIPAYKPEDEVVINISDAKNKYNFPNDKNISYRIEPLARTSKMPLMKGFSFEVLSSEKNNNLITSLHSYVYNYGSSDVILSWEDKGHFFTEIIHSHDSFYMEPFVKHGFSCLNEDGKLYVVRIPGSVNLVTQRELSFMPNIDRVFDETKQWFD